MEFTFDYEECNIDDQEMKEHSGVNKSSKKITSFNAHGSPLATKIKNQCKSSDKVNVDYVGLRENAIGETGVILSEHQSSINLKKFNKNDRRFSKSQRTTKDQITQMLKMLVIEKKKRELAKGNSSEECENKILQNQNFISMKDVQSAESEPKNTI